MRHNALSMHQSANYQRTLLSHQKRKQEQKFTDSLNNQTICQVSSFNMEIYATGARKGLKEININKYLWSSSIPATSLRAMAGRINRL